MSASIHTDMLLPIVLAGLKSLPKDPRINKLVAAATAKAGFPAMTVDDLVTELTAEERPMPRPNSRMPIMVGGARNNAQLFVVAIILLYVLAVYGLARAELLGLRELVTAAGGAVFIPMLMRFADQLFTEKRLFVAQLLENEEDVVVRLDFKQSDRTLKHENDHTGVRYSTVVGLMDPTYGELPRLDGGIYFALLHHQTVRLLPNGAIDIPRVNFQTMRARLLGVHRGPDYQEERDYYFNAEIAAGGGAGAIAPLNPDDPAIPYCDVRATSVDPITLNNINEHDVLINFNYGVGYNTRLYNCDTRNGTTMTYASYMQQTVAQKMQWLNSEIDMASRSLFKAHIVQEGGRRRRRSTKAKRRQNRRTIRR